MCGFKITFYYLLKTKSDYKVLTYKKKEEEEEELLRQK